MDRSRTALVIGAGPAGLMAAETLARAGVAVAVHDRMPSAARKFLMAGRGGLNLTHSEDFENFPGRYGAAADWLRPALTDFPPAALRDWAHGLGQETFTGSSGRVFPKSLKASPLLRAWLARLRDLGVTFQMRSDWRGWDADGGLLFADAAGAVQSVAADAVVLALGGGSWPRLGSTGGWTGLLAARGIDIAPLRPANCGFNIGWSEIFRTRFAGQPLKNVLFSHAGRNVRGEAVVTGYGIEGGAVYALSAALRDAAARDGAAELTLDLRPDLSAGELAARLARGRDGASAATALRKAAGLPPLAANLLREAGPLPADFAALAARIKALPLRITGAQGLDRAISSAGGLALAELDERFMLRKQPGVFACGEMLDWEAPTGGYLLQACFATGRAAGRGASEWLATTPNRA